MDAPERELLLAAIDNELNSRTLPRIQRVRLLDLWWRVATYDGLHKVGFGQSERELLAQLLRRIGLAQGTASWAARHVFQPAAGVRPD